MKIIIQTTDFKATKKLERFVQKNVQKLEVVNGRILESRVCLKFDNSDTNEDKVCEIKLVIAGNDLFASKQTATFEESIIRAIDALKHQIDHLKTVRENKRPPKRAVRSLFNQ